MNNITEALNVKVYGNGSQYLVLSHGFGTDQSVWHYLLPVLVTYFKVVVFDLAFSPNVNHHRLYDSKKYSSFNGYANDLVGVLDSLNVNNTIYMGHSMSAMIGCLASVKRPDLFQHLILLGGSPRYLNSKGYIGGFERSEVEALFRNIDQNYSNWVRNFAPKAVGKNDTAAITEFKNSLQRMNPKIVLKVAKTVFLSDYRKILHRVLVPCTIIQSQNDYLVPKSVAFYMHRRISGRSRVKILKTEGHFPHLSAYSLLLKVLKRILIT